MTFQSPQHSATRSDPDRGNSTPRSTLWQSHVPTLGRSQKLSIDTVDAHIRQAALAYRLGLCRLPKDRYYPTMAGAPTTIASKSWTHTIHSSRFFPSWSVMRESCSTTFGLRRNRSPRASADAHANVSFSWRASRDGPSYGCSPIP